MVWAKEEVTHDASSDPQPSISAPPDTAAVLIPETEAVPIVLDLARRIQFAQRLAALIRRIQTQPRVQTKKEQADES